MLKSLLTLAMCLPLGAGTAATADKAPDGAVLVKILPVPRVIERKAEVKSADYVMENDADAIYEKLKAELDAKFAKMFELKSELDAQQEIASKKWNEYWTMNEAYNKQLKKIVAAWVTQNQMSGEDRPTPLPMPRLDGDFTFEK